MTLLRLRFNDLLVVLTIPASWDYWQAYGARFRRTPHGMEQWDGATWHPVLEPAA